ncbi:unnamed protein product [Ectocarpus sp. 6 AP-2014]
MVVGAYVRAHNTAVVVVLLALLCCASCLQQPAAVEETSRRQRPQQQQQQGNQGNSQAGDQAIYPGEVADVAGGRDGARFRRRLLSESTATPPNSGANEQHQQLDAAGEQEAWEEQARAAATTTTSVAARRTIPGMHGGEEGARAAAEGVLEGGVARAAHVQTMDVLEAESGGAVEAAVGEGAEKEEEEEQEEEEDKGIEEGEAGGFVVVAPDSEPEQRGQGENIDNDNASTNGISNNVMVIVFCALAFVANGGFLVYVFWVM